MLKMKSIKVSEKNFKYLTDTKYTLELGTIDNVIATLINTHLYSIQSNPVKGNAISKHYATKYHKAKKSNK